MNNCIFWVALAAYALHIMEEFFYNWKGWAINTLKLTVDWDGFYITNTAVLFLGIACAETGWSCPVFALSFPALMVVNAIFFHILPVIITRKNSPGLFTAILLFLPITFKVCQQAILIKIPFAHIVFSLIIGFLLMAYPIVLLKTKELPFFKQA